MAKKSDRINTWLICKECGTQNYVSTRNKVNTPKMEISKYCPVCKKHTDHKSKDKLK